MGSGPPADPGRLPKIFQTPQWREVRLDVDPNVRPDIVASITAMPMVVSRTYDAVWSSHNLEHLHAHEVPLALAEFARVLKPDGFLFLTLPDLQRVAEMIAADKLDHIAYQSPAGPIAPIDMIYGHRASLAQGNLHMAHKTGFSAKTLKLALSRAGFPFAWISRIKKHFILSAIAFKQKPDIIPDLDMESVSMDV